MTKIFSSIDELYYELCNELVEHGREVNVRNMSTKELIGKSFVLQNPRKRLLQNKERRLSPYYALGEWLWYMSGSNSLEFISYYAPSMWKYSDDKKTLNGAYGKRIKHQLEEIILMLKKKPNTRQAIITIFDVRDLNYESLDIPCTLNLHFLIRDNKLHLIVNMRSNDIYLGLPYDIFAFTMIQEYVASMLNVELGSYYHHVSSLHYYTKDEKKIERIICNGSNNTQRSYDLSYVSKNIDVILDLEQYIRTGEKYSLDRSLLNDKAAMEIINQLEEYKESKHND